MDEYLFIELAKLKADRLKLEREQRMAQRTLQPGAAATAKRRERAQPHWFARFSQWRGQS